MIMINFIVVFVALFLMFVFMIICLQLSRKKRKILRCCGGADCMKRIKEDR